MNELQYQISTATPQASHTQQGLIFTRRFTTEGVSPYDELQWEQRTASITDQKGNIIFEQKDVEVPARLVDDRDQHCGLEVPARAAGTRPSGRPASANW